MKKYLIWLLICAFLVIGGWGNRESFPVAAWVSIVLGVVVLLWPLGMLLFSQKAKLAAVGNNAVTQAKRSSSDTLEKETGLYDWEYSEVGLYRPAGAVSAMPPLGAKLRFEEEPENPYDAAAVRAVYNGETVGYFNKTKLRDMVRDWINRGDFYKAEVTRNDTRLECWIGMDKGD